MEDSVVVAENKVSELLTDILVSEKCSLKSKDIQYVSGKVCIELMSAACLMPEVRSSYSLSARHAFLPMLCFRLRQGNNAAEVGENLQNNTTLPAVLFTPLQVLCDVSGQFVLHCPGEVCV